MKKMVFAATRKTKCWLTRIQYYVSCPSGAKGLSKECFQWPSIIKF